MDISGKNILVTGGAGFIGSHLVDQLNDCNVRVLDNLATGKRANIAHTDCELVEGDILDRPLVARLMQDSDVVFNLACRGVRHSIHNPEESHEVNALGTLGLLVEARRAGVERFVHISSSEVYGTARYAPMDEHHPTFPETVYGGAKLAGEAYVRAYHQTYGLPTVVVRPFNNFGPRSHHEGDSGEVIPRFAVWALNGQPPVIFGDGTQTRDFIYVEETAAWLRRVAECDDLVGETINLGSGVETSVAQLAEMICEAVGRDLAPRYEARRPGDVDRHLANVDFAREKLGFETTIDVREGIRRFVDSLRQTLSTGGANAADLLSETSTINWQSGEQSAA